MRKLAMAAAVMLVAAPAAADEVKIGYVSDFSGAFVDTFVPVYDAFRIYFDELNASGGIDGDAVVISSRDDQLNPTRATSLFRELVVSENVNSVWSFSLSSTLPPVYELAERLNVPAISSVSAVDSTLPPAQDFAYSTGNPFSIAGVVAGQLAAQLQSSGGVIVCVTIESAGGKAACENTETSGAEHGFDVTSIYFPPRTVEYGALGQSIADAGPTIVITHLPAGLAPGVLSAARTAGYTGDVMMHNVALNEVTVAEVARSLGHAENTYIFSRYALSTDDQQAVQDMRGALERGGINPSGISSNHVIGWVHAMVAEAAIRQCGSPCNAEEMNASLNDLTVELGDLTGGPVAFSSDDHQGTSWWRIYAFSGAADKFVAQGDWVEVPSNAAAED
ncbi:MAG: ABC transporter substrate-binding protein [Alphaproteobacteria bacterium]